MRAIVCKELGPAEKLVMENDWPLPETGEHDIVVKVIAAGLNFPDVLTIQGKYQMQPEMPFIPCGECSGIVEAVGEKVTRYKPGDKVIVAAQTGALCEKIVVSEFSALPMPASLSFVQAAGICITYFTSHHALKQRANLQPGETVLVLGAGGGVGITAVELAKAMGATVIAAASSEEKLALAKKLGADHLVNYNEKPLKETVKALTEGRGVDVVYDPVGGDYSEPALRCMARNGRFLVIGFASGPIPKIPLNLTLLKECAIVGVFWGSFSAWEPDVHQQNVDELWQMFESGKLNPVVSDVFPLSDAVKAFNCLSDRRALGKVVVQVAAE